MDKKPSAFCFAPDLRPGALPLDPTGGSVPHPKPLFRLALHAIAMAPLWQILDPPLILTASRQLVLQLLLAFSSYDSTCICIRPTECVL